jgi:hypothetical protein
MKIRPSDRGVGAAAVAAAIVLAAVTPAAHAHTARISPLATLLLDFSIRPDLLRHLHEPADPPAADEADVPRLVMDSVSPDAPIRDRLGFTDENLRGVTAFSERLDASLAAELRRGALRPGGVRPPDRLGVRARFRLADGIDLTTEAWTTTRDGLDIDEGGVSIGARFRF